MYVRVYTHCHNLCIKYVSPPLSFLQSDDMNSMLYKLTKSLGFHLPVLCGRQEVLLPGPKERVEVCMSDVIVQMGSAKCVGQVYLTDYR